MIMIVFGCGLRNIESAPPKSRQGLPFCETKGKAEFCI